MYETIGSGGGGDDGRPRRRGTSLAPELDRRLAGDEPLEEAIFWWHDSWRASVRLRKVLPHGDENVQPRNFSDNELACFVIAVTSGCGSEVDETDEDKATSIRTANQLAELHLGWDFGSGIRAGYWLAVASRRRYSV
jgi:hypothetical protein